MEDNSCRKTLAEGKKSWWII